MSGDSDTSAGARRGPGSRLAGILSSVPFAASVVAALAVVCIVGTVLPQGREAAAYVRAHPGAAGRMELFNALGLTRVYSAWWFLLLLGLLAASLAVCTYRRFEAARRASGRARGRAVGSLVTHISLLLVLAGGVVRGVVGERGVLELSEGQTRNAYNADDGERPLPFSVHLVCFEIETYESSPSGPAGIEAERLVVQVPAAETQMLPVEIGTEQAVGADGAARVRILQRVPDFVIDMATREVSSRSDQLRNPALKVAVVQGGQTNVQWLFALHPDFNMHADGEAPALNMVYQVRAAAEPPTVKDFKSHLRLLEGDAVVKEKTIEVNAPLSYKGYTFYQSGYDPDRPDWTSLQVVRDPGVPFVYAGFALMICGLTAVFYLYPGKRRG